MRNYYLGLMLILLLSVHSTAALSFSPNGSQIPPHQVLTNSFSLAELETASPFDPEIVRRTYYAVAKRMNIRFKSDVPFPSVVLSTDIPVDKIPEYTGIEIGSNLINYFGYLKNTIMLIEGSKIHNLAHEMAHYFQFHYHIDGDITQLNYDPEPEAVHVQNFFRQVRKVRTAAVD